MSQNGAAAHTELVGETSRTSASIAIAAAMLLLLAGIIVWLSLPRLPKVTNVVKITNDGKPKFPMNLFVTDGVHLYFMEEAPFASGSGIGLKRHNSNQQSFTQSIAAAELTPVGSSATIA